MIDVFIALEAGEIAQFLKRSRWIYPLVNAGHIFGIALLIGAVIPMDVAVLRGRTLPLRAYAAAGLTLAVVCGALLFMTQATDYVANGWFQTKAALLLAALVNAASFIARPQRISAALSLALWPAVLVAGRMVAYS